MSIIKELFPNSNSAKQWGFGNYGKGVFWHIQNRKVQPLPRPFPCSHGPVGD
jgi:hypothetical protein